MRITLKKSHSFYSYVGKNEVAVCEPACKNFECFSPHNWSWRHTSGTVVSDFRCNYREHNGCPDHPEKRKDRK